MTIQHAEHVIPISENKVDDELADVILFPHQNVIEEYKREIEGGLREVADLDLEIEEIQTKLRTLRINLLIERELKAIQLGTDDSEVMMVSSERQRDEREVLVDELKKLHEVRARMEASIKELHISLIRHEEAVEEHYMTT